MSELTVLTHSRPAQTGQALRRLAQLAAEQGVTLRVDEEETRKHELTPAPGLMLNAPLSEEVQLCIVLGGDGTILRALRHYGALGVPVFSINFGEIGFLATVEHEELDEGARRALAGDFELLRLPAIALGADGGEQHAFNDAAIHRKVGERVAEVAYMLEGEELGSVRCDGLVVATPAGSTGYNLANGGPVMAWGVEGYLVSFIAPHSLTARALVVAPADRLTIQNRSREALDISLDGRPLRELGSGEEIELRFVHEAGTIAQLPGSSFYRTLRTKFGRLAR
jgi:NAD+ kinase